MPTATKDTLTLISPNASLWVSIVTNTDEYNANGGRRTVQTGQRVRFEGHRAVVSADLKDELEGHPGFGSDFFFLGDPRGREFQGIGGPRVVSGQAHGRSRDIIDDEPLPGWDDTSVRELRKLIDSGEVIDLVGALAYEGANKARSQVLEALGSKIRTSRGDSDEVDPAVEAAEALDPDVAEAAKLDPAVAAAHDGKPPASRTSKGA